MKLQEIVANLLKLDANKEYEVQISEEQQQEQNTQVETPPTPSSSPGRTEQVGGDEIEQLRNEINTLKQVNLALLQRTPVEGSEMSTEQRIFELVTGFTKEGAENGSN